MPTILDNGVLKNISVAEYNSYMASLRANIKLNSDGTQKSEKVEDLDKIWINGQEFSGMAYQGFLTVNTKTYVEEPTRANDGSIPNINDYDTFIVPRCKVNFKYLEIEDYRRLCDAIQSNEFNVKYYDKQFNKFVVHKMYCEPEEMVKLYNIGTDVFGLLDYEVSFIGTLNDLSEHIVKYVAVDGDSPLSPISFDLYNESTIYSKGNKVKYETDSTTQYYEYINESSGSGHDINDTDYWKLIDNTIIIEDKINWGNSIVVQTTANLFEFYNAPTGKQFVAWNTKADGSGSSYFPNQSLNVFEDITLYPMWRSEA